MAAERRKGTQAAGEHDDLLVLPGPAERVEHQVDAVVVAIDERVVEDDRHIAAALRQQRPHGETHKHGDLLLRAAGEPLEALRTRALHPGDREAVAELELRSRKKIVEVRAQVPPHGIATLQLLRDTVGGCLAEGRERKSLQPGAVVLVTRLDRLARSTIDLLTTVKQIADKECLFKSLAEPWADTTTPAGRLILTVLGGLAEFERELIKIRTTDGRERAKRVGRKDGPQANPQRASDCRNPQQKGERRISSLLGSILSRFAKYNFESEIADPAQCEAPA